MNHVVPGDVKIWKIPEANMVNHPSTPKKMDREALPIPAGDLDLDQVRAAVRGIRYGEVRVVIQDGQIVQIDRLEKQRIR